MEKKFFTSDDVSMLSYGCGVSQYPQLYYRDLDKYQVLPRTYWGSFEGFPVEKFTKEKWMLDLVGQAIFFVFECIERIMSKKYWKTLKECLTTAK